MFFVLIIRGNFFLSFMYIFGILNVFIFIGIGEK